MGRPPSTTPTPAEMEVLRVLWTLGPTTIRDLQEATKPQPNLITLTATVRRMIEKKLVRVVAERRPQKIEAALSQDQTYGSAVEDLRKRIFGGSLSALISHALKGRKRSAAEMADLRSLLGDLENKDGPKRENAK